VWYEATYTVFAVTATGVLKITCCHPVDDSLVNVAVARRTPPDVHRLPTWTPLFAALL